MAVESTNISVVYTVTSAASGQEFPIPFPYIEKEHVIAYYSDDGDVTNLTYGTGYTVSGTTLTVAVALPVGAKLVLYRVTPLTQEIDWEDGQAVYTPDIEQADDKLTFIAQEFANQIDRAVKITNEDAASGMTPEDLREDLFEARDAAAASATAASGSATLAQAWAQSSNPPDSEDSTSKSAKTWAGIAKDWAQSTTAPDPDDNDSKSAKSWAGEAATSATAASGSASAASGSATQAAAWAESDTPPDPNDPTSKSAKSWAAVASDNVPIATTAYVGKVKPDGTTVGITSDGTISAATATVSAKGIVKPDGSSITIDSNGVVSAPSSVPVGTIIWSANATVPAGYLLCNGSAVGRATYPELFAAIGTAFGSGDGSTTFNLPNLIDKFIEGSTTAGTVKTAGLPNIAGATGGNSYDDGVPVSGPFYRTSTTHVEANDGNTYPHDVYFDASLSNPIYGNSNTVQPPAVTALPCIKAFAAVIGDATVVAGQLVNEIQSKVALDGSNLSGATVKTVVETWNSGTEWYRVWSDGWIEQGGRTVATGNNTFVSGTITFYKEFSNTDYFTVIMANYKNTGVTYSACTNQRTTTTISYVDTISFAGADWMACGF